MNRCAILLGLLTGLFLPASAHALGHIIVGNEPIGTEAGYGKEVLALVNTEERVYAYIHDWHRTFYFKGGPKALNEAMRRFAAIPDDRREIILLPAPGKPLLHDKPIAFDWCLRDVGSRSGRGRDVLVQESEIADNRATLTIYIPEPLPPAPADEKAARKWIADIGSDEFKTRERAAKELADMGPSVAALIREALKGKTSPEARDRMERILASMSGVIRLDVLQIPDGVPVVSLDSHLARCRKELESKYSSSRGDAAWALLTHGSPGKEIVPDLEKVLKNEKLIGPLVAAARAAWQLGVEAKTLVPVLAEVAKSEDANLKNICEQAIANIEKAKAEPVSDAAAKRRATIRREIRDYVAARTEEAGK